MIPLALGAAVSPLVFAGAIAVMTGQSPLARGGAYAVGVAIPLLSVTAVVVALGHAFSLPDASETVKGSIDAVLGAVLVALGLRTLRSPPARAQPHRRPEGQGLGRYIAMGAGLMASNVTTFALYVPALKLIEESGVDAGDEALALAIVLAVTMALVLVPLATVAIAPEASERALTRAGDWFSAHRRTLTVVVCLGFGAYLLIKGFARL